MSNKVVFNPFTGNLDYVDDDSSPVDSNVVIENVPCNSIVSAGDWIVMQSGQAEQAQANSLTNSNVLGVVISKSTSVLCNVRIAGVTESLFTALDPTKEYYLSASTPGEMTTTPPSGNGEIVLILGQPYTDERFVVNKHIRIVRAT
jgi:hypothetical protein